MAIPSLGNQDPYISRENFNKSLERAKKASQIPPSVKGNSSFKPSLLEKSAKKPGLFRRREATSSTNPFLSGRESVKSSKVLEDNGG